MLTLRGKGVSGGVAIGRARLLQKKKIKITHDMVSDTEAEWRRYEAALRKTVSELELLYEWSREEIGHENAQIFSVHAMMAQDEDFNEAVRTGIGSQKSNAAYAVSTAAQQFSSAFAEMDDAYMRERAADVGDIAQRILQNLIDERQGEESARSDTRAGEGDIIIIPFIS